jgi:hypothetical protein
MRKIAIIQFHDNDFVNSITDWKEVDDDTFKLLKTNLEYNCKIVEQMPVTIDYYVNLAKEKDIKKEEAKKKAEEKRKKLEIKKDKILKELQTKDSLVDPSLGWIADSPLDWNSLRD